MDGGGAYGGGKAGGPFDPIAFVQRPQVILRALCWVSHDQHLVTNVFSQLQTLSRLRKLVASISEPPRSATRVDGVVLLIFRGYAKRPMKSRLNRSCIVLRKKWSFCCFYSFFSFVFFELFWRILQSQASLETRADAWQEKTRRLENWLINERGKHFFCSLVFMTSIDRRWFIDYVVYFRSETHCPGENGSCQWK